MTSIVGFFILFALMFYGFEVFWLRVNENLKNDDIDNDVHSLHHHHVIRSHTGKGRG